MKGFSRLPTSPKSSKNKCAGCGHGLLTHGSRQAIQTAHGSFHPECFQCSRCKQKLTGKYALDQQKPFCEPCYLELKAEKCSRCGQAIQGEFIKALGRSYHAACFGCAQCKSPFRDGKFCEVPRPLLCGPMVTPSIDRRSRLRRKPHCPLNLNYRCSR